MKKLCSADHPVWAMAFRPFYLLCALYGAFSVLLWGFGYPACIFFSSTPCCLSLTG